MENFEYLTRVGLTTLTGVACGAGLLYGLFEVAPRIIESAEVVSEVGGLGIRVLSSYYGMGLGAGAALLGIIVVEKFLGLEDRI